MYEDDPGESSEAEGQPDEAPKPVGLYQKSDEDIVKQVMCWFKESADASNDRRIERKKEWQNLANDQWEATDKAKVEAGGRPALTMNLLLTIMAAVEGEERTNRQEIKIYGVGQEDDPGAFGLNKLIKWVMEMCGGEFALSEQFRSGSAVGEGWVVPEVDYFDDPEGTIKLEFVDEDQMYDDPLNQCPVSTKSRYTIRIKMTEEDEFEARWPGKLEELKENCEASGVGPETDGKGYRDIYSTPNEPTSPKLYDAKKRQWAVLEVWWYQIEPGWVVVDEQTGFLVEKSAEEVEALKAQRQAEQQEYTFKAMSGQLQAENVAANQQAVQQAAQQAVTSVQAGQPVDPALAQPPQIPMPQMPPPIQAAERMVKKFYQAFVCYKTLLEKRPTPIRTPGGEELKRIPYIPFRALYDKPKQSWFGLLKPLLDPQKQHNVEQSVIVQLMQLMPKASWMAPKGAYHNKQEWEQKVAKPGSMLEYNASRGKPEQIKTPDIPRHLIDMALSRPISMREISGVNVEMTGQRQGSDPGVVMEMRSKAAKTVLAPIFDNNRRSKKELGRVLVAYIQCFIKPGRQVRVLGPEGMSLVTMSQEMQLGRYDLAVEETNSSINDRMATLAVMQTTLPQMMKAGMAIPPEFVDLLPMAPHIRDALKRQIAWQLTTTNMLPPPGWNIGDPMPMAALPPPTGAPAEPAAPAQ